MQTSGSRDCEPANVKSDGPQVSGVLLPDLTTKNTGFPVEFQFQVDYKYILVYVCPEGMEQSKKVFQY